MTRSTDDHFRRVVREAGVPGLVEALAGLRSPDLTTLLLEVMRLRAAEVTPPELTRSHTSDRFVRPGDASFDRLRRVEDRLLAELPDGCRTVTLAPLVPLGTHSAIAPVHQDRVVATVRGSEVAADPTNGLALEAAVRRRDLIRSTPRSSEPVRLATVQRVVRGQQFDGADEYAHFTLFGMVTAGRDTGNHGFESAAVREHAAFLARGLRAAGADRVAIEMSDFTGGRLQTVVEDVLIGLSGYEGVETAAVPERTRARGYYEGMAIRAKASFGGNTFEVADGGLVDWTRHLVGSRKERLMISGIGLDRIALAAR
jgi:hypothetical protein